MPYKNFSNFRNIKHLFGNCDDGMNYGFTCDSATPVESNPRFDDSYFLLYRRSEYAAQVELACAKIFINLMGYGPELEIVEEQGNFYIASRKIKNFKEGAPRLDEIEWSTIYGFAAMFILSYFLAETDMHGDNYGGQLMNHFLKAYRIDMAESLDFGMLANEPSLTALQRMPYHVEAQFHGVTELVFPKEYIASPNFQNEKKDMIQLIAAKPFAFFADIIRSTVTKDFYSHQQAMRTHMNIFMARHMDEESIADLNAVYDSMNPNDFSTNRLIELLGKRHACWQNLAGQNLEQDYSLASHDQYNAEASLYHEAESDNEEDNSGSSSHEQKYAATSPRLFTTNGEVIISTTNTLDRLVVTQPK